MQANMLTHIVLFEAEVTFSLVAIDSIMLACRVDADVVDFIVIGTDLFGILNGEHFE